MRGPRAIPRRVSEQYPAERGSDPSASAARHTRHGQFRNPLDRSRSFQGFRLAQRADREALHAARGRDRRVRAPDASDDRRSTPPEGRRVPRADRRGREARRHPGRSVRCRPRGDGSGRGHPGDLQPGARVRPGDAARQRSVELRPDRGGDCPAGAGRAQGAVAGTPGGDRALAAGGSGPCVVRGGAGAVPGESPALPSPAVRCAADRRHGIGAGPHRGDEDGRGQDDRRAARGVHGVRASVSRCTLSR